MKKADDKFILQFPKDSGFTDTEIYFYSGTPDIMGIYFSEQNANKMPSPRVIGTFTFSDVGGAAKRTAT